MVDNIDNSTNEPHLLSMMAMVERRLGKEMADRTATHDAVTRASHARLLHLLPSDGARPSELAEGWISKQAIGKRIGEMVDAGLVAVTPDPDDGRARVVRRTATGDRNLTLIMRELTELESELAQKVGERRYRIFREVLDELGSG